MFFCLKLRCHLLTGLCVALLFCLSGLAADQSKEAAIDQLIHQYAQAVGGEAALQRITSRELHGSHHRGSNAVFYWQAPNKVLRVQGKAREGFDGSNAWAETQRKKIKRLPDSVKDEIETDANPVRYVKLREMYKDLQLGPSETLDGKKVDVIVSPNHIGSTKFYFDSSNHLLVRINEFGVNSAYYKHTVQFSDYREVDGVKLPFQIERTSDEPGAENGALKISKVKQNVEMGANLFTKPNIATVVSGGKR